MDIDWAILVPSSQFGWFCATCQRGLLPGATSSLGPSMTTIPLQSVIASMGTDHKPDPSWHMYYTLSVRATTSIS